MHTDRQSGNRLWGIAAIAICAISTFLAAHPFVPQNAHVVQQQTMPILRPSIPAMPGESGGFPLSIMPSLSSYRLPDSLDFCGEPVPLGQPHIREQAERELYLMLQDQGQLILDIKRSGIFFPIFERIAREDSVPDDLKYIAVIESALRNARSAKDAFGIWQFIEGTGRKMGLEIDKDIDERLNIAKATRAAYDYLKEGHSIFHTWTMAAAGYNMGHEFLAEQVLYQRDSDFYNLYLNEETSRYVFRIVIMKEIMQHPERYGIHLLPSDIYKPDSTRTVTVNDAISDIEDWAIANGTTYKWVKVFNPWILNHSLPKPKREPYAIVLPVFDSQQ